jgi:hypothetical protein
MSARLEKKARSAARNYERRFDEAFERQMPRWCRALIVFCEGVPMERLLRGYIGRWRARNLGRENEGYKKYGLKVLARTAKRLLTEAGCAGSNITRPAAAHGRATPGRKG